VTWTLHHGETVSGALHGTLPLSSLTWSDDVSISRGSTLEATIPLDGLSPDQVQDVRGVAEGYWRTTLVLSYDDQAVVAGPLVTYKVADDRSSVTLGCGPPGLLLAARMVIAPGFELDPTNPLASLTYGATSLPEIARQMIADGLAGAQAALPFALPAAGVGGSAVQTYAATDLGNVLERLGQLSTMDGGPDVHLQPVLGADQTDYTIAVRIGEPRLGQVGADWVWTSGGNLLTLPIDGDASQMGSRVYVPGRAEYSETDEPAITPVGVAEDLTYPSLGWPLLERADREHGTSEVSETLLYDQARAWLTAYGRPVEVWRATVRADLEPYPGTWRVGDDARIRVVGDPWLGDTERTRRILTARGGIGDEVDLGLSVLEGGTA
jgi:hypothetical protein